MKKIILILSILAICQSIQAQDIVFFTSKKNFISSEIVLNNGNTITGFIKDFRLPHTIEVHGFTYDFSPIESKINLDRTTFKFKKEMNGSVENLNLLDIKSIKLMEEDTIKYEKLKLKTINSSLKVVNLEREVMIPLISENKINLYGLMVNQCSINCRPMFVIAYIKKPNDEFAFIPIDFNRINMFNLGKVDDKFLKAFEEVGKDCPEFMEYIQKSKILIDDKVATKDMKSDYYRFENEKKEKLNQIKNRGERKKMSKKLDVERFLRPYFHLIEEYSIRCK